VPKRIAVRGVLIGLAGVLAAGPVWAQYRERVDPRWMQRGVPPEIQAHQFDSVVGFRPPAFADDLTWLDGEPVDWESLEGRVVFLQSWNLADQRGRHWLNRLEQLRRMHAEEDVVILALHTPPHASDVSAYLERSPTSVPVVIDSSGRFCDRLGFYEAPNNVLVDRNGRVRIAGLNYRGAQAMIDRLVEERMNPDEEVLESPAPEASSVATYPPPDPRDRVMAKDLRGAEAPALEAQRWFDAKPEPGDRSLMVVFFRTWSTHVPKMLPVLNAMATERSEDLVVVGMSAENPVRVRRFIEDNDVRFPIGVDRSGTMLLALQLRAMPHALLISPDGVVRWQGQPLSLRQDTLERILAAAEGQSEGPGATRPRWTEPPAPPAGGERAAGDEEAPERPDGG